MGYPFDKVLVEEPWRAYEVLEKLIGIHNTDIIISLWSSWLKKNGCQLGPEALKRYLTDKSAWPTDSRF